MPKDTILIADDDRTIVAVVSAFLQKQGFNVVHAFDAMQAVMMGRQARPSLVIMDINMPGGTGMEAMKKLRAMIPTSQIPVIVLTASGDPALPEKARELGAAAFFTKPVKLEALHQAVLDALGRTAAP